MINPLKSFTSFCFVLLAFPSIVFAERSQPTRSSRSVEENPTQEIKPQSPPRQIKVIEVCTSADVQALVNMGLIDQQHGDQLKWKMYKSIWGLKERSWSEAGLRFSKSAIAYSIIWFATSIPIYAATESETHMTLNQIPPYILASPFLYSIFSKVFTPSYPMSVDIVF